MIHDDDGAVALVGLGKDHFAVGHDRDARSDVGFDEQAALECFGVEAGVQVFPEPLGQAAFHGHRQITLQAREADRRFEGFGLRFPDQVGEHAL